MLHEMRGGLKMRTLSVLASLWPHMGMCGTVCACLSSVWPPLVVVGSTEPASPHHTSKWDPTRAMCVWRQEPYANMCEPHTLGVHALHTTGVGNIFGGMGVGCPLQVAGGGMLYA